MSRRTAIYVNIGSPKKRRYTFFHFMFDVTMTVLTCGLWLIWIFVRWVAN